MRYFILAFFITIVASLVTYTGTSQANTSKSYLDYAQDRTVLVYRTCEDGVGDGWGSGVIWEGNKVVTAEHLVDDREGCTFAVSRAGEDSYPATVAKEDTRTDLALLNVAHDYGVTVSFARSKLGEAIVVVGYPAQLLDRGNQYLSILYGYISTKNVLIESEKRYVDRISAPIYFGNSGGPVFNSVGQVVGIVSAGHMHVQGYFYTARGHDILKFLGAR